MFEHIVEKLDALGIAYIHVVEGATGGPRDAAPFDYDALRTRFRGTYIAKNGFDQALAEAHLANGNADLIAFGRPCIANPNLVERMKASVPLAQVDPQTLYGGGAESYTDYPVATVTQAGAA